MPSPSAFSKFGSSILNIFSVLKLFQAYLKISRRPKLLSHLLSPLKNILSVPKNCNKPQNIEHTQNFWVYSNLKFWPCEVGACIWHSWKIQPLEPFG